MQKLGVFDRSCQIHPNVRISNICSHKSCSKRVLCHKCLLSHDSKHENHIISILDLFAMDIQEEFKPIYDFSRKMKESFEEEYIILDKVINDIRIIFEKSIEEFKKQAKHKISKRIKSRDLATKYDLSNLLTEFKEVKNHALKYNVDDDHAIRLRTKFIEIYKDLIHIKSEQESITGSHLNSFVSSDYQEKIQTSFQLALSEIISKPNLDLPDWSWDFESKSPDIKLSVDQKTAFCLRKDKELSNQAILGDVLMSKGINHWKLECVVGMNNEKVIALGIVPENEKMIFDCFVYSSNDYIRCLNGYPFDTYNSKEIEIFDCELNFNEDYFSIKDSEGKDFLRKNDVNGKKFYPIAILNSQGDIVSLVDSSNDQLDSSLVNFISLKPF